MGTKASTTEETVFTSAARTATANSADQENYQFRGCILLLNISAASGTTPTLDLKVQLYDKTSGAYMDIPSAAFAQKTTTGSDSLVIYPGIAETANRSVSDVIPRNWRVVATIAGTTPSFTFSLGVSYIV